MELGFPQGDSFIHRLDPRARIIVALLLAAFLAVARSAPVLISGLAAGGALIVLARLNPFRLLWHLLTVNAFIAVLWLTLPFSTPGNELAALGPLHATREGIRLATQITLKSNAILLTCVALLTTMDVTRLGHALHHLHVPDKLIHILLFTARYFGVLHREYHRLTAAMKIRCFRPRADRHTWRTYGYLIGMLLVNSLDRSERVLNAMKCRGFKGRFYILDHFAFAARDGLFLCASAAFIAALGVLEWATTH